MNRREFSKVLGATVVAPTGLTGAQGIDAAPAWSLSANLAECCSCEIPCPCNFGRPTSMRCDGNRLIEIYEGNVGDMDLSGIRFLVTFEMREWTRIYVDDGLTDTQMRAFEAILPLAFPGFSRLARSVERVPLTVTRTIEHIEFTTPVSEVTMKPMAGLDGGRIAINGLPSNNFYDYVQYESVKHTHKGPDREWAYSGTNGFTSRMTASSG